MAGYGTGDIGIALQAVIQQARRLRQQLYLLYMDLATFFPRIDREIGTVGECLHGISNEVAWLVGMIYCGFDGKPPVNCRFDTGSGLGTVGAARAARVQAQVAHAYQRCWCEQAT